MWNKEGPVLCQVMSRMSKRVHIRHIFYTRLYDSLKHSTMSSGLSIKHDRLTVTSSVPAVSQMTTLLKVTAILSERSADIPSEKSL